MATNIEIKARVHNFEQLQKTVERLSDSAVEILQQEDTFFDILHGRLKLRKFSANHGQLIFYERDDREGPKPSFYVISRTADPDSLREVLSRALGLRGVVKKTRLVYQIGQTRVHLDQVAGLGQFVELEVVMKPIQPESAGEEIAQAMMQQLQIQKSDLISGAYIDMLKTD